MNARAIVLWTVCLLSASAAFADTKTYTKAYSVTGRPSVQVNADDARVKVQPSNGQKVEFEVEYEGYVLDKTLRIESRQEGDRVHLNVHTIGHVGISLKPSHVRIEVRMPREADLKIDTGDGAVSVASVNGKVSIHTGDGSVQGFRLSGTVDIRTADGSIRAETLKGELRMYSGDGSIEGTDLDGKCDVTSGDGHVKLAGRFEALDVKTGDGGVEARVAAGSSMSTSWNIRSGDGGIQMSLPEDFQASLDASTSDGKISLGIPVAVEGQMNHSRVRGTMNGGGPALTIHTGDGSIRLEKS